MRVLTVVILVMTLVTNPMVALAQVEPIPETAQSKEVVFDFTTERMILVVVGTAFGLALWAEIAPSIALWLIPAPPPAPPTIFGSLAAYQAHQALAAEVMDGAAGLWLSYIGPVFFATVGASVGNLIYNQF